MCTTFGDYGPLALVTSLAVVPRIKRSGDYDRMIIMGSIHCRVMCDDFVDGA